MESGPVLLSTFDITLHHIRCDVVSSHHAAVDGILTYFDYKTALLKFTARCNAREVGEGEKRTNSVFTVQRSREEHVL